MIAFSDNTATNLVLDQIGLRTTSDTMEQLGFPHTKIHAKVYRGETSLFPERSKQYGLGSTTAAEMIRFLEQLHKRELASEAACESMVQHLLACEDKDLLAASCRPERSWPTRRVRSTPCGPTRGFCTRPAVRSRSAS